MTCGSTNTSCDFFSRVTSGDYYDDTYPAGRCDFLHVLFNGHILSIGLLYRRREERYSS